MVGKVSVPRRSKRSSEMNTTCWFLFLQCFPVQPHTSPPKPFHLRANLEIDTSVWYRVCSAPGEPKNSVPYRDAPSLGSCSVTCTWLWLVSAAASSRALGSWRPSCGLEPMGILGRRLGWVGGLGGSHNHKTGCLASYAWPIKADMGFDTEANLAYKRRRTHSEMVLC